MSPTAPIKLEPRDLEELTEEEAKAAHAAASAEARARWGVSGAAVETGMPHEIAAGHGAQVGVRRVLRLARKGFRPRDDNAFVALGRGRSWVAAFADADAVKKKIEEKLGDKGIAEANATYARRISKLHR